MKTLQELFTKYLNNQCSPEEVQQLLAHFNNQHNEKDLKTLITESLEMNGEDEGTQWTPALDQSFLAVKNRLSPRQAKRLPLYQQPWFKVAAAVVVLVGGFGIYSLIKSNSAEPETATVDPGKQTISPANNKATLTLADGSTIVLQNAANGTVANQGSTKIEKAGGNLLTYISQNEKPEKALLNTITTPRGGLYQVVLSDGSKVWLNAASTLRFPAHFNGSERKVELSGEAYFEVAKNTAMPFKVAIAGRQEVEVLGTHFNVNAYTDEPVVKTTLLEGKVKIIAQDAEQPQILYPGQESRVTSNGTISINKNADTEQTLGWKNGHFSFDNANLEEILRELSRWYDVDVQFEGPVPDRQFTGEIQRDLELSQVLKLLERHNVSFKIQGKTLFVQK